MKGSTSKGFKSFAFRVDREKILLFKDVSARQKLEWLEEANRFCRKFVKKIGTDTIFKEIKSKEGEENAK